MATLDSVGNESPTSASLSNHSGVLKFSCLIIALDAIVTQPGGKALHSRTRSLLNQLEGTAINTTASLFKIEETVLPLERRHCFAWSKTGAEYTH